MFWKITKILHRTDRRIARPVHTAGTTDQCRHLRHITMSLGEFKTAVSRTWQCMALYILKTLRYFYKKM